MRAAPRCSESAWNNINSNDKTNNCGAVRYWNLFSNRVNLVRHTTAISTRATIFMTRTIIVCFFPVLRETLVFLILFCWRSTDSFSTVRGISFETSKKRLEWTPSERLLRSLRLSYFPLPVRLHRRTAFSTDNDVGMCRMRREDWARRREGVSVRKPVY